MGSSTVLGAPVCNNSLLGFMATVVLPPGPLYGANGPIPQRLGISDAESTQLLPSGQCFLWQETVLPKVIALP